MESDVRIVCGGGRRSQVMLWPPGENSSAELGVGLMAIRAKERKCLALLR
jgi:hypothetical protein